MFLCPAGCIFFVPLCFVFIYILKDCFCHFFFAFPNSVLLLSFYFCFIQIYFILYILSGNFGLFFFFFVLQFWVCFSHMMISDFGFFVYIFLSCISFWEQFFLFIFFCDNLFLFSHFFVVSFFWVLVVLSFLESFFFFFIAGGAWTPGESAWVQQPTAKCNLWHPPCGHAHFLETMPFQCQRSRFCHTKQCFCLQSVSKFFAGVG